MGLETYLPLFFLSIGFVLVLMFTIYWNKKASKHCSVFANKKKMRIVDRIMLGKDKYIVVVDAYNTRYLVGVTGQQITLLKEMGDGDLAEDLMEAPESFSAIFGSLLVGPLQQMKERWTHNGGKQE